MLTEEQLEEIAASNEHAQWIIEHHVSNGTERGRCAICETWWPCDLGSLAALAILNAKRSRTEPPLSRRRGG